jgi:pimeloyl-ACP methyl ester carboxylesterase
MRTARTITVLLLTLASIGAACGAPSADPTHSPLPSAAPAGGNVGAHEAARYEELRHWSGTFYGGPDPLPVDPTGSLIRLERVASDDVKRVYRMMYLSTSVDGTTPVPVTGTLWVPVGDAPEEGFPIVTWGPGSNPFSQGIIGDGCAFSVRPIDPGTDHQDHFAMLLGEGFVVATTDYIGHGTRLPYFRLVPETDTHALVDAARAARDLLGPAASDRVIVAGFSQGGVAASGAQKYLADYADGLDIRGVVSIEGGGDFERVAELPVADTENVQETMSFAYAWPRAYPELRAEDVLTQEGLRLLDRLHEGGCTWFHEYDTAKVLDASIPNWLDVPAWAARIRAQTVPSAPFPVFYLLAGDNPTPEAVREVADRLCEGTDHVDYRIYPETDHYSVISAAFGDWVGWMTDRVTSDEPFDGCAF